MKFKVVLVNDTPESAKKLEKLLNEGWRIAQTDYKDTAFENGSGTIFVLVDDQVSK